MNAAPAIPIRPAPRPHVILGLDPGFASLGWALVALHLDPSVDTMTCLDMGVLRTQGEDKKRKVRAVDDNVRRTREIASTLRRLLDANAILVVGAEAMSFPRSSSVAGKMCLAWGALVAELDRRGIPLEQVSPQVVKRQLCGAKGATKDDVEAAVIAAMPEAEHMAARFPGGLHEHMFDAAAVAMVVSRGDLVRTARRAAR
jgi:Holliday junction resolvasome RuvABC endonuclease subunit